MGFTTLDDKDCRVRKPLPKFKWADVVEAASGQTIKNKNLIELAASEAKDADLEQPYVKIGQVKKNLIFRIKHKKGHWGEDDIVVVSNFVAPVGDGGGDDGSKPLLKSAGSASFTSKWWNAVSENVPDADSLGGAIDRYETVRKLVDNETTLAGLDQVADALTTAQGQARAVMQRLGNKDDKKAMLELIAAIKKLDSGVVSERESYLDRQAKASSVAADSVYKGMILPDIEKVKNDVTSFSEQIKSGNFNDANRSAAKLFKTFDNLLVTDDDQLAVYARDAVGTHKVVYEDFLEVLKRDSRRKAGQKKLADLKTLYEKLVEVQEKKESERGDREEDHPERSSNNDPVYRQHLAEINRDFKGVLRAITDAANTAGQVATRAKGLATNAVKGIPVPNLVNTVQTIRGDFDQLEQDTIREYAKIRNNSGSIKIKEATYGIQMADKNKFTTPVLNRCMAVWYRYRTSEGEALKFLVAALTGVIRANPDDDAAVTELNDLKSDLGRKRD